MDYTDRPVEAESLSLYDWIRVSRRVTMKKTTKRLIKSKGDNETPSIRQIIDQDTFQLDQSESDRDSAEDLKYPQPKPVTEDVKLPRNHYRFKASHDLYDTHVARIQKDSDKVVVNFVGATLPRRDRGDYEYYCCTMLTLFKPWRLGHDLKASTDSWADTHAKHEFSEREATLMNNFMIRYECLDARDDYRAQMSKENALQSSWDPLFEQLDNDDDDDYPTFDQEDPTLDASKMDTTDFESPAAAQTCNAGHIRLQKQKNEIRSMLQACGWNQVVDNILPCYNSDNNTPIAPFAREHWANSSIERKEAIINERSGGVPPQLSVSFK
ncbi:hypothetical protein MPER_05194 [Moniliophthora perniciosa FA553]|nr:hypothetical protein MPER_05194 [Moniliophthora perniciosa FA553]